MSSLLELMQKPERLSQPGIAEHWFTQIAQELLNNFTLLVGKEAYRLVEIEFYCFDEEHQDIFTHRDPLQQEFGRWYFHRKGGEYKSGSFKGLDLTFGDGNMFAGILIRSIESYDGTLICGPSLCVDWLLEKTQISDVASFDLAIANKLAWDKGNILRLQPSSLKRHSQVFSSARVGLSLKKAKAFSSMPMYIMRPYRYLSEPKKINKGKVYLVLALHAQGFNVQRIHDIVGASKHSIEKYIADFEAGLLESDLSRYLGIELNTTSLCQLHGTWRQLTKTSFGFSAI